jgi:hypothetical protein
VKSILKSGAERKNDGAKTRDGEEVRAVLAQKAETWGAERMSMRRRSLIYEDGEERSKIWKLVVAVAVQQESPTPHSTRGDPRECIGFLNSRSVLPLRFVGIYQALG